MPQQTESAMRATIGSLQADDIGRKLRIAGRMLSYDPQTALVLLHDQEKALLVDVSLCIDPQTSGRWVRERKNIVYVIGYLEQVLVSYTRLFYLSFYSSSSQQYPTH
ncbi:hypothetical protein SERLA73DRAFT_52538 [Serpula lacrymans var. lacrymans S7.3]|uniref:Uncharacterized protein n=1 Tax=Serpula lacrymans var. lacrymans (strain S7.3) TaxID=936435 RepID=F8PUL1_SERL3|nr:hypothetical protein SERLA73DRAFT_52538 [Serpula lacrymans var. lacrymans S7.3]